jgi:ankyrin repeat protein
MSYVCKIKAREAAAARDVAAFAALFRQCKWEALEVAVEEECVECIEAARADRRELGWALIAAARAGRVRVAEALLRLGADPNAKSDDGLTALHHGAHHARVVQLLLKYGADPNARDWWGRTPLHQAAYSGCVEAVELLLQYGADPGARDRDGLTALDYAATGGCYKCLEVLLEHLRPTERTLAAAVCCGSRYEERRLIVERLLEAGVSEDALREAGCGFFVAAVERGDADIVARLLRAGFGPNECGEYIASLSGSAEVFRMLVKAGARGFYYEMVRSPEVLRAAVGLFGPRHADRDGLTPLHAAARLCDVELVEELLSAGADPNARDRHGRTPLEEAVRSRCAGAVKALLTRAEPTKSAVRAAARDIAVLSLIASARPDAVRAWGGGALVDALNEGNIEVAVLLISMGVDPNAQNSEGDAPLHIAASRCLTDVMELLLSRGADPNLRNRRGWTPLHYASCPEAVRILTSAGADVNAEDEGGWTPLCIAAWHGDAAVAEALLQAGADPSKACGGNVAPLDLAIMRRNEAVAALLRRYSSRDSFL